MVKGNSTNATATRDIQVLQPATCENLWKHDGLEKKPSSRQAENASKKKHQEYPPWN